MPFKHHPSTASILSVLNGTAHDAEKRIVLAHVAACPRCQAVSERHRLVLRELSEFNRLSSQNNQNPAPSKALSFPKKRFSVPAAVRYAGGAIAASLFILFFAWPRHIQTVSAAELLSKAEASEDDTSTSRHYRLNIGTTICNTADPYWSRPLDSSADPCAHVRSELLRADWSDHQMLSARSYRKWHDSLTQHRDSVQHQEPYWTLKTDTNQGHLRSASLRVRSSDYRPVELTLEFAALQPVSVVEDQPLERHMYVPPAQPDKLARIEPLRHVDEPADAIEVQAWNMLRSLGADSGWEATITRKGGEVRVVGFIDDASRREKFEQAFSNLQGVTLDLHQPALLPHRGSNGDAQPLAEHTLETLIPDSHERGQRVTEIADASRAVVGKAYFHDRLIERRNASQDTPAAHALTPLLEEERGDLLAATARLSDLLEPLVDTKKNVLHSPLSYAQARTLDAAVLSLVNAAPKQSASLEQTEGLVRSLLSRN
jgi:hypothetical protein